MRIATWNINGLRARLDFVLRWLEVRQPDVVGLQELKLEDKDFPHEAFEGAGYTCLTHGQKSWNGVATLTRQPAKMVQQGLPGQEDFGARLLEIEVEGLRYATLYCPNGKNIEHDDYPRKLAWFDALIEYVQESHDPGDPLLLGGDFNICPEPLDSWNEDRLVGGIFHTEAERQRMRSLAEWGLGDLYRKLYPDTQTFSWWDYRGGAFHRGMGLRIDLLLGTAAVAERVVDCVVDRDYRKKKEGLTASDHAPVWVDLEA